MALRYAGRGLRGCEGREVGWARICRYFALWKPRFILHFALTFPFSIRLECRDAIMQPANNRGFMHKQTQINKAIELILETMPSARELPRESLQRLAVIVLKAFRI